MDTLLPESEQMALPPGAIDLPRANQVVTFSADAKACGGHRHHYFSDVFMSPNIAKGVEIVAVR